NETLPSCFIMSPAGTKMQNALNERESFTVAGGGRTPELTVPGTSAKLFVAQSELRPLDPVVTQISPAHDATAVAPDAPIVIHFSKPMDTASVEHAFSTVPPVKGAFAWTAAHDQMTFTPDRPGFEAHSAVTVRLGETARD